MNRPISEEEQEAPELVETDEVLDFYEFEDEKYLADIFAPPENGSLVYCPGSSCS